MLPPRLPWLSKGALEQLVDALGDAVRSDPITCENYRYDWTRDATAGLPGGGPAR